MKRGLGISHGSQEWGGNGFGRWKWNMKRGLGAWWFPRVGWEGFGNIKNEVWTGGRVFLMVPKSGVGRGSHNTFRNHFEPSQAFPTSLLWTIKHPTPLSCFIFCIPRPFLDPFMFCQVCLVRYRFVERKYALSNMPDEMPFSKNKLKKNMLCHLCQVYLVKCRFEKKIKENMLCQIYQMEITILDQDIHLQMPICKNMLKKNMFVK